MKTRPYLTAILYSLVLLPTAAPAQTVLTGSFPTTFYPPRTSQFDGTGPVLFPAVGVMVQKVRFSAPSLSLPLPAAGQGVQVSCTMNFSAEVSSDGGATWAPVAAPANSVMRISRNAAGTFDTEMLALNISGGLGAGVLVRESPTRQSLGAATVTPGSGLFKIDSFFDIFTELSVNGGQTWIPAAGTTALHVDMSRMAPEQQAEMNFLPPPGSWTQVPGGGTASYMVQTVIVRGWDFKRKGAGVSPPGAGSFVVDPWFDVYYGSFSFDGGATFHPLTAEVEGTMRYSATNVTGTFDTEMLSMNLSAPRPDGVPGTVMLRESPTRASTGKTTQRSLANGGYMIGSFFDIFTELSLDGGQTWSPVAAPVRLESAPPEFTCAVPTDFFPPRGSHVSVRPGTPPVLYSNGSLATFDTGMLSFPPSGPAGLSLTGLPAGTPQNISLPVSCAFTLQHPLQPPASVTATGDATFRVTKNPTGTFDTEMLSLNLTGGGFRLRETPTRASTGKINLTQLPGGNWAIGSFFDVFTELSVDNGQTWLPADGLIDVEGSCPETLGFATSSFLPLRGRMASPASDNNYEEHRVVFEFPLPALGGPVLGSCTTTPIAWNPPRRPPGSQAMITNFSDVFTGDLSFDGGQTFQTYTAPVSGSQLTNPGTQFFDSEMLQLDIQGGNLPPGVMLRESPTRASTGRTTIVPVDGGYRIGSFFDIFTEISLDGGQTWNPGNRTLHLEHQAVPHDTVAGTDSQPSPGRYVLRSGSAGAKTSSGVSLTGLTFASGDGAQPAPASGEISTATLVPIQCEVTLAGGDVEGTYQVSAYWTSSTNRSTDNPHHFDTEMLALDIQGGSLPQGVRLRESPTRRSTGKTTVILNNDGTHRIGSFFDIFTEISLDGGQTWEPTDKPLRLDLTPPDAKVTRPQPNLPRRLSFSAAGGGDGTAYANGVVSSFFDVFFDITVTDVDLAALPAGGIATGSLQGDGSMRLGGGVLPEFEGVIESATSVRVTHVQDSGGTRFFDTEMLSLSVQGGALPAGVMIRESPTRASLGRATLTSLPGGTHRIGSFFDIFTEISLDNGTTWSPSDGSMRIGAAPVPPVSAGPPSHYAATDFLPPPGRILLGGSMTLPDGTVLSQLQFKPDPDCPRVLPPVSGLSMDCCLEGSCEATVTGPGGQMGTQVWAASLTLRYTGAPPGSDRYFDTEMLALDIQGIPFRIRESPTRASTGLTRISDAPGGGFMVDSFFDIFTELSVDGGQSWTPSSGPPAHGELAPQPVAVAVPTDFFPPRRGEFSTLPHAPALDFGNGQLVRKLRHTAFEKAGPLAGISAAQVAQANHTAHFEYSGDGGQSWKPHTAPAAATINMGSDVNGGTSIFNNEFWSLSITGGTLPQGLMIRESPTLPSRGKTTARMQPGGSYHIDSFFDVFTELSIDGGQTWQPASGPAHVELVLPPQEQPHPSNFLPLTGMTGTLPSQPPVFYAQRAAVKYGQCWVFGTEIPRLPPPGPGQTRQITITQDMLMEVSTDGGGSFVPVRAPATLSASVEDVSASTPFVFDTTLFFTYSEGIIQGGDLPQGMMIRESPTRASTGRTTIRPVDGGFMIDSFFDIFTEISLDGGQNWLPGSEPVHFEHTESTRTIVAPAVFPPRGPLRTPDGSAGPRTAGGASIVSLELTPPGYGGVAMPGPAPVQLTENYAVVLDLQLPGQPVQRAKGTAPMLQRLTAQDVSVMGSAGPPVFDTEMLQLDLQGGGLPPGVMIRESPTRRSTGRTTLQENADGTFRIGSFFDIFTEMSFDDGQTWEPTDTPTRVMLLPAVQKIRSRAETLPPAWSLSKMSGQVGCTWPAPAAGPRGAPGASGPATMNSLPFILGNDPPALPGPGGGGVTSTIIATGRIDLTLPDGAPVTSPITVAGHLSIASGAVLSDGTRFFDTEMLQFDITGSELPRGMMLRESPTLKSTGKTTLRTLPDGAFQVDSFFDIFTELSLDGGKTWTPSDGAARLDSGTGLRVLTGVGGDGPPRVRAFNGPGGMVDNFLAWPDNFTGGVRVAAGDVNGDGHQDIITGAGPGGGPHIKVFDGRTGGHIRDFFAYGSSFAGGVTVAAGDVNGDGRDDIITGSGAGGPAHVKVFDGATGTALRSFLAFDPAFTGGVTVAAGDVNGDSLPDLIIGAAGTQPHVKVFDGLSGQEIRSFFAYPGFTGGVFVAAGDLDGDGHADIVTGAGAGGGPHVKVFSGQSGQELQSFFAYPAGFTGGVRVAAGDVNGDGFADVITAPGAGGAAHVKVFDGRSGAEVQSFFAYPATFTGGCFVGLYVPRRTSTNPTDADDDGLIDPVELTHALSLDVRDGMDDSDGDGAPAVVEFGFGLDPNVPDIALLPPGRIENGFLTLTIQKRPGVLYTVQSGDSTGALSPADTTILENSERTLKVRDNVPFDTGPRRFMSTVVTGAP